MLINMLCILCYLIRDTSVPTKFCQVFPVIFYGIIGATVINIAVVTIKNAVRIWSTDKAEKVKSPHRAFVIFLQFMIFFEIFVNAKSLMGREIPVNRYIQINKIMHIMLKLIQLLLLLACICI